jgi:hypothetical protein
MSWQTFQGSDAVPWVVVALCILHEGILRFRGKYESHRWSASSAFSLAALIAARHFEFTGWDQFFVAILVYWGIWNALRALTIKAG